MTENLREDEDTEESYQSWVHHQHTKKRAAAQRKEMAALETNLLNKALVSTDPDVRQAAALLHTAKLFVLVFEGHDK